MRRQRSLAELGAQKQAIRRLNEKLQTAAAAETEEGEASDVDEEEEGGVPVDDVTAELSDDDYASLKKMKVKPKPAAGDAPTSMPATATGTASIPQSTIASELRNRKVTIAEQRDELFGGSATTTGAKHKEKLAKAAEVVGTEALLDMQRSEQEDITADLLHMAKLLKESSLTFGEHLESEKGYLDAAKEGLDRNASGLTTAGSNMDSLRKNDNVSFIWSLIYMAMIVALVSGRAADVGMHANWTQSRCF